MLILKRLFIPALTLLLVAGCSGGSSDQNPWAGFGGGNRATSVETTEVQRQNISRYVRAYGNIRAQDNVRISPQISERISSIHADLGDTVSQGQLLARLRDTTFQDQLRREEAQLEQAQVSMRRDSVEYARATTLYDRQLISEAELDNARVAYQTSRANVSAARASLTQSRENLAFTEVRSPVRGVVTRRSISPGDLASTGTVMFEIANLLGYEIRTNIPLADRRVTRVGQQVQIRLSGEREHSATGVVSRISPEMDPITGLAEIVISLTNMRETVIPGSLAEASISVETRQNTIVVPRSALVENVQTLLDPESNTIRLNRTYNAYVAVGDTVAQVRQLELGLEQGDRIEVLSGLEEGERIVITGQGGLEDGSRVRVTTRSRPMQDERGIQTADQNENRTGQPENSESN